MKLLHTILISCAIALMCSIGFSSSADQAQKEFDLANYFFHRNLKNDGVEFSYLLTYHTKINRKVVEAYNFKRVRNGAAIDHIHLGKVALQYFITDESIEQRWPNSAAFRERKRYANIGDTYVDNHHLKRFLTEDCSLENHLDELDVNKAIAIESSPDKIFENVLHVICNSQYHEPDGSKYYWKANKYYAYGYGLILMQGHWYKHGGGQFYALVGS